MILFKLVIKNTDDTIIEDQFWNFIDNNEICTVQADCDFLDKFEDYEYKYSQVELTIVPQNDEDKKEFMQLCNEMIEYFEELGYNF